LERAICDDEAVLPVAYIEFAKAFIPDDRFGPILDVYSSYWPAPVSFRSCCPCPL